MSMQPEITWDTAKESKNVDKHSIDFDEAATVFLDPLSITYYDAEHSDYEDREITIGLSAKNRSLLVVHTEREGNVIRIISARKLTAKERKSYEERV